MTVTIPSLSLSTREASATTFYELDTARKSAAPTPLTRIGQWIAQPFAKGLRAMQYARMLQAMSDLSDVQLEALQISRADIPRRARAAIYDTTA